MASGKALKARQLTKLQWEFILTAWRQSLDFAVVRKRSNLAWKLGMFGFYYARGRWAHGPQFKYPAMRFAGVAEEKLAPHLYLRWDRNGTGDAASARPPRLISKHAHTTAEDLARAPGSPLFGIQTGGAELGSLWAQSCSVGSIAPKPAPGPGETP